MKPEPEIAPPAAPERRIIINGSTVITEERLIQADKWQLVTQTTATLFLEALQREMAQEPILLPPPSLPYLNQLTVTDPAQPPLGWVRVWQQRPASQVILFEQPPQVHSLTLELDSQNRLSKNVRAPSLLELAFPWVVFVWWRHNQTGVSTLHCYFRQAPLAAFTDTLLGPALPNIGSGPQNKACFQASSNSGRTVYGQLLEVVATFWRSIFTSDYATHYHLAKQNLPQLATFATWAAKTKADPAFITRLAFPPIMCGPNAPLTVHNALRLIDQGD
ncbi:MAG: hypothetical protein Q8P59_05610 [Dehalococcoidia bacterium]|nr:hypothetical protein [Dehalococcoidia bacterium]